MKEPKETAEKVIEKAPLAKEEPIKVTVEEKPLTEELGEDFEKDLDKAIAEKKLEEKPVEKEPEKDLPSDDKSSTTDDEKGGKSPETKEDKKEETGTAISDDLLTRAVKAGIDLPDARDFKDASSLERMCVKLEKLQEKESGKEILKEKSETDSETDDLFKDVPELSSEGEDGYDEGIVDVVNGLKKIITDQHKEIGALKKSQSSNTPDFVDSQIALLGDEYKSVLDQPTQAAVRKKFDILAKGYEAVGENVTEADVFGEAMKMVVGDVEAQVAAKKEETKKALEKRASHATTPPSGKKTEASKTPEQAAADALREKFPDI